MTGFEVRRVRQSYDLTVSLFAYLLGVHHTSIYRWEAYGPSHAPIEPMQSRLLDAMANIALPPDQLVLIRGHLRSEAPLAALLIVLRAIDELELLSS